MSALLKYFDTNGDGEISHKEFLAAMSEPMSARKSAVVSNAWTSLGPKDDKVSLTSLEHSRFKQAFGRGEGELSKDEFFVFYTDVAMQSPSDAYFVQHMQDWWGVCEDDALTVENMQVRHLVS